MSPRPEVPAALEWRVRNDTPLATTVNVHVSVRGARIAGIRCRNARTPLTS